ncbi:MAG: ATP-binding cassette domain-containing protein [Anaerolineae bacterium]
MIETVIALRNLDHTYLAGMPGETQALHNASLTVQRGEIAALIGPNGAGKSTLVSFINGLLRPQEMGRAVILGQDTADPEANLGALRARVGLAMQYPHQQLFERYVGDDVAYGPRQMGLSREALRERVRWAMEEVGLGFEAFVDRRTFSLSGGEMRRAALAGVIAMHPEILVLDEATAGLDQAGRRQVHDLLRRLRAEQGLTVVLVSNEMDEVAELADTVTILNQGRTTAQGSVRKVLGQADLLEASGLDLPEAAEIARRLIARGVPIPGNLLTAHEVEEALWQVLPH